MYLLDFLVFIWFIGINADGIDESLTAKRFLIHTDRRTWNEAREICEEEGGRLAVINNKATLKALLAYSTHSNNVWKDHVTNFFWIGLSKEETSKDLFRWDQCEPFNSSSIATFFSTGHPNNPDAHCVSAEKESLEWRTEQCQSKRQYLCEIEEGTCSYSHHEGICLSAAYSHQYNGLSIKECEEKCSSELYDNLACWMYSYNASDECVLYFDGDPEKCSATLSEENSTTAGIRTCFTYEVKCSSSAVTRRDSIPQINCDIDTNQNMTSTEKFKSDLLSATTSETVTVTPEITTEKITNVATVSDMTTLPATDTCTLRSNSKENQRKTTTTAIEITKTKEKASSISKPTVYTYPLSETTATHKSISVSKTTTATATPKTSINLATTTTRRSTKAANLASETTIDTATETIKTNLVPETPTDTDTDTGILKTNLAGETTTDTATVGVTRKGFWSYSTSPTDTKTASTQIPMEPTNTDRPATETNTDTHEDTLTTQTAAITQTTTTSHHLTSIYPTKVTTDVEGEATAAVTSKTSVVSATNDHTVIQLISSTDTTLELTQNAMTTAVEDSSQLSTRRRHSATYRIAPSSVNTDPVASVNLCPCRRCFHVKKNKNLEELVVARRLFIKVDKTKLSATRRKKESAKDDRPSAQAVGCSGLVFIIIWSCFFIGIDIIRFCQLPHDKTSKE